MRRRIRRPTRKANIAAPIFIVAVLATVWAYMGNEVMLQNESDGISESRGSRNNGFLVEGKRLPTRGDNFETYSRLWTSLGRTCVHEQVRDAIVDAYAEVYDDHPELQFVYGEMGWCGGGDFWPHRTHQNGLSADLMVPVRKNGRPANLPTSIFEGWGYRNEFDDDGRMGDYDIDFDALALHLEALRKSAKKHGLAIVRVILEPPLQEHLFAAKGGKRLKRRLNWMQKPAWVRHDDHIHVDFVVKKQRTAEDRERLQKAASKKAKKAAAKKKAKDE